MIKELAATAAHALVAGALALAGTGHANTVDCQTVTHADLDGITTVDDPAVELTDAGVRVETTVFGDQGATWWQPVDPVPLTAITGLSYQLHLHTAAAIDVALPAYLLKVKLADDTEHVLVFEPYYSGEWTSPGDVLDADKVWDVAGYGGWWSSTDGLAGIGGGGSYASNQTLTEIAAAHEGIEVVGFGWRQEWAAGLVASIDHVEFKAGGECQVHSWAPHVSEPSPTPTGEPTPTVSPSPGASESPAPGVAGGADDQLPITGSSWVPAAGLIGVLSLGVGGLLAWTVRRKRGPLFTLPTE